MIKRIVFIFFLIIGIWNLVFVPKAFGAIRYPVRELQFCRNAIECKLFCEIPSNTPACWAYDYYVLQENVLGVETEIQYPIEALGNCTSKENCRQFCSSEENKTACTDYALKNNLIKSRVREISRDVLQKARTELGCNTATSCHNYCRKPENADICKGFGEKYSLIKKVLRPTIAPQIFEKTRSELGCANEISCKNLCANPENTQKCRAFAAKYELSKLTSVQKSDIAKNLVSDGICKNEVECAAYCKKNPGECPGFAEREASESAESVYLGPGGCKSIKECFQYCQAHPDECPAMPRATLIPTKPATFGDIPKTTQRIPTQAAFEKLQSPTIAE